MLRNKYNVLWLMGVELWRIDIKFHFVHTWAFILIWKNSYAVSGGETGPVPNMQNDTQINKRAISLIKNLLWQWGFRSRGPGGGIVKDAAQTSPTDEKMSKMGDFHPLYLRCPILRALCHGLMLKSLLSPFYKWDDNCTTPHARGYYYFSYYFCCFS